MSVSTLSAGTHQLTATYKGNSKYGVSTSSPYSQVVNRASTTTTLSSNVGTTTYGQSVTFTAKVTSSGGTPSGLVVFSSTNNGVPLYLATRSLNSSGVATLSYPALPGGTNSVTATYQQSGQFTQSVSTALTQTVNKASVTASISASPNPVAHGSSVTLTATIVAAAPAGNYETPLGTVSFYYGTGSNMTLIGTQTLAKCGCHGTNTATITTTFSTAGNYKIKATYNGDQNYSSASSPNNTTLTVN